MCLPDSGIPLALCLLFLVSCFLPFVLYLLYLAACLLSLASCLSPLVSCLMFLVSCLLPLASRQAPLVIFFSVFVLFTLPALFIQHDTAQLSQEMRVLSLYPAARRLDSPPGAPGTGRLPDPDSVGRTVTRAFTWGCQA